MIRGILLLCTLFVSFNLSNAFGSEEKCTYCGGWLPIPSFDTRIPGDFLLVARNQISFPGCDPIEARIELTDKNISRPSQNTTLEPIRVVYSTEYNPKCKHKFPIKGKGLVLEIELHPRSVENGEELIAEVYERSGLEQVLIVPNGPDRKAERYRMTPLVATWRFIRWDHRPCEEGTTYGFKLCNQLLGR